MNRREFLIGTAAASAAALAFHVSAAQQPASRQLFELRTYHFASQSRQTAFEGFVSDAMIPAMNRAGVNPVGAFKPASTNESTDATPRPRMVILLPHNSLESVLQLEAKLAADEAYQTAGRAILMATKADPVFVRFDSMLLLAMEGAPRVQVPTRAASRVFELRTYESPTQERAANKLAMFNAGEFAIFEQAHMGGVFYGGALIGPDMPQLTYMIVHQSMADAKNNWSDFFAAPQWKKLSSDPSYKDNVSKVHDAFLIPAPGSQI